MGPKTPPKNRFARGSHGSAALSKRRPPRCASAPLLDPPQLFQSGAVLKNPHFFFQDSPQGPPTATNRHQPPPTANHCSVLFLWSYVVPIS